MVLMCTAGRYDDWALLRVARDFMDATRVPQHGGSERAPRPRRPLSAPHRHALLLHLRRTRPGHRGAPPLLPLHFARTPPKVFLVGPVAEAGPARSRGT